MAAWPGLLRRPISTPLFNPHLHKVNFNSQLKVSPDQTALPFPKSPRIQDPELLAVFRTFPCLACGASPSEAHHITTRGAGGDDVPANLMPLCSEHHREWHDRGAGHMIPAYPRVRGWLEHWNREDVLSRAKKLTKKLTV